ncbi:MAG: HIT domain-containing protein [Minisyncoccia bacterium]
MNCVFCKIINKKIPANIVYEDKKTIAIYDIKPKAEIHILIIPKKHIKSIITLKEKDKEIITNLIFTAKKIAKEKKLKGYKLIFNVEKKGGQIIPHLHLHLLGGKIENPLNI